MRPICTGSRFLGPFGGAVFLCAAVMACGWTAGAEAPVAAAPIEWLVSRNIRTVGDLTLEDIRGFKTEWTDPKSGSTIRMDASFSAELQKPGDAEKYKASGQVPFRVTVDLEESKSTFGKLRKKSVEGIAVIHVLDSDGKTVAGKSTSLAKLCRH